MTKAVRKPTSTGTAKVIGGADRTSHSAGMDAYARDAAAYQTRAQEYNTSVSAYNTAADKYNAAADSYYAPLWKDPSGGVGGMIGRTWTPNTLGHRETFPTFSSAFVGLGYGLWTDPATGNRLLRKPDAYASPNRRFSGYEKVSGLLDIGLAWSPEHGKWMQPVYNPSAPPGDRPTAPAAFTETAPVAPTTVNLSGGLTQSQLRDAGKVFTNSSAGRSKLRDDAERNQQPILSAPPPIAMARSELSRIAGSGQNMTEFNAMALADQQTLAHRLAREENSAMVQGFDSAKRGFDATSTNRS
jgi:hypothetical protein